MFEKIAQVITTPVPTPETALLSLHVGKPFKPQGREIRPEDCIEFDDCVLEAYGNDPSFKDFIQQNPGFPVVSSALIAMLFRDEDNQRSDRSEPGLLAAEAYSQYTSLLAHRSHPVS